MKNFYVLLISVASLMMASCGNSVNEPDYNDLFSFYITSVTSDRVDFTITCSDANIRFDYWIMDGSSWDAYDRNATAAFQAHWDDGKYTYTYFNQWAQTEKIEDFMEDLDPDTYYVLFAYQCDEKSNKVKVLSIRTFRTLYSGELPGVFSVSATKKVRFSRGNLQATYDGSTWTWAFADKQYDYIGDKGANDAIVYGGMSANGTLDLFEWSTDATYYGTYTKETDNYDISGEFIEWGKNVITNGGYQADMWRTLNAEEWCYLFGGRAGAKERIGLATVNGAHGLIILPDNWVQPEGVSFQSIRMGWNSNYYEERTSGQNAYTDNIYTDDRNDDSDEWDKMQRNGALFLPAAGYRFDYLRDIGEDGLYWSSTYGAETRTKYVHFSTRVINPQNWNSKENGRSVRLVRDVE